MYKIALIDDKSYWLTQVKNAIPEDIEADLEYFDSYQKALWKKFDIIVLDYYLDIDWVTWEDIISKLDTKVVIWFSSVDSCNKRLKNVWAKYIATKLAGEFRNPELEESFLWAFNEDLN